MNKGSLASWSLIALLTVGSIASYAQDAKQGHGAPEPPMAGIQWAKGAAKPPQARPGSSPNLIYHNGPVQHGITVTPIFWGTSWTASDPEVQGMNQFYVGVGGSSYANTNTEYTDSTGQHTSSGVSYNSNSFLIDPSDSSRVNGQNTSPILSEVCSMISNPQPNGYYPVYVDHGRGHAQFCAWHSAGTCGNTTVTFAFFFKDDGDPGCDPGDDGSVTGHSQGVAALGNVSGHELSEQLTDPQLNAWYDSGGAENADKCAWTFGTPALKFTNNTYWMIQGNWSNNAYNTSTGYPNSSGQQGCIDGGNYK